MTPKIMTNNGYNQQDVAKTSQHVIAHKPQRPRNANIIVIVHNM